MVCECGNGEKFIFDKDDFDKVKDYYWSLDKNGNPTTHIKRKTVSFARFIMNVTDPRKKVLQKHRNSKDYRKNNLFAGNTYAKYDTYYEGECYGGQKFKIDIEDFELISLYIWHVDSNGYLITKINGEVFKQHRMILGLSKNDPREVDHIHHDQLDNRKANLRIVNRSQNCQNTRLFKTNSSGIKGVYRTKKSQKWLAQITSNKEKIYLGSFNSLEEARAARLAAEQKLHGEYACNENRDLKIANQQPSFK